MAKNMTRKGLALGAAFALVGTALVAQPAAAANEIVLAPSAGTLNGMISGETFTVQATVGSTIVNTQYDKVKYSVSNPSGLTVTTALTATGSTDDSDLAASTATSGVVKSTAGTVTAQATTLAVSVGAAEAGSVSVTAWIDSDGDDVIDSTEYSSAAQTIVFTKVADVVANVTIDPVLVGDTAVSASAVLSGINMHQLTASDFGINFTYGDGTALMAATTTVTAVTANADTKALETGATTIPSSGTVAADSAVKAQLVFKSGGSAASTDTIGSAATLAAVAVTAGTVTASSVSSTTANASDESLLNSTFQVKAVVKDTASTPAVVPGAAVSATITTDATLSGTAGSVISLGVNGTTYTANSALPGASDVAKLALTADANGEVFVTLTTTGYSADDTVTVAFVSENVTGSVTSTQKAATYTVTHDAFAVTTDGASVSVPVAVYDQFGGRPSNDYDVRAVFSTDNNYVAQATTASTSATSTNVALVGGNATLVITDNGEGLGVNSYDVTVEARAAGGGYGSALTGTGTTEVDVHIVAAATLVPASLDATGVKNATTGIYENTTAVALSLVDTADYNSTTVLGAAPTTFTNALTAKAISGTVKTVATSTVAAVVVPGAKVTLSGAGLQFGDGSGKYSADSITVTANTSGVYSANVYSNKAGTQTITISSGAATATATVVFEEAKDDTGVNLVINAPASVLPGSTLSVSAVLTDKFGNTVTTDSNADDFNDGSTAPTFSLSSDAPGFQIGTNPTVTDNDGAAKLAYFLGVNDSGTVTVTATYDADGTGTTSAAVTVTATIVIGTPAVATWTKNLGSGEVKMYAKNIVGAGKVQFMLNGAEVAWVRAVDGTDPKLRSANGFYYLVRTVELVEGQKNVLEIYVDGVRTTRTAYTY